MPRTITVKGVGRVSAKPDYIVLSLSMYSHDQRYDQAMEQSGRKLEQLRDSICSAGFEKEDLKTTNFTVRTDYKNVRDRSGNSTKVFNGYVIDQDLKLSFDFDSERLSRVLAVVSECFSNPEVSIQFTMEDPTAISDALLQSAAENAKKKAEVLCASAGVKLGELQSINYSWGELNIYSNTEYDMRPAEGTFGAVPSGFEPEDIDVNDTATFVWEIK